LVFVLARALSRSAAFRFEIARLKIEFRKGWVVESDRIPPERESRKPPLAMETKERGLSQSRFAKVDMDMFGCQ